MAKITHLLFPDLSGGIKISLYENGKFTHYINILQHRVLRLFPWPTDQNFMNIKLRFHPSLCRRSAWGFIINVFWIAAFAVMTNIGSATKMWVTYFSGTYLYYSHNPIPLLPPP
jgi:hypothetical protein